MSGGHYDYTYFKISHLAEQIEREFENDGKYMVEDFSVSNSFTYETPMKEEDHFKGATEEQKAQILSEIRSLVNDLKKVADRARELEFFMSGDTGFESYLKRVKKIIYI